jgi:hypothetical protein
MREMNAEVEHRKCVEATITHFHERRIQCVDFEELVGREGSKRPDLLLPMFNTLLEVKTFAPQEQEIKEAQRIGKELNEGNIAAYWHPTFYDRFGDHLRSARRKFRVYPTYHTAVLFSTYMRSPTNKRQRIYSAGRSTLNSVTSKTIQNKLFRLGTAGITAICGGI